MAATCATPALTGSPAGAVVEVVVDAVVPAAAAGRTGAAPSDTSRPVAVTVSVVAMVAQRGRDGFALPDPAPWRARDRIVPGPEGRAITRTSARYCPNPLRTMADSKENTTSTGGFLRVIAEWQGGVEQVSCGVREECRPPGGAGRDGVLGKLLFTSAGSGPNWRSH